MMGRTQDMRIGFFDSGLGGLAIMRAVERHLPHYAYTYYGDTKNLPYGEKSESEVCALTQCGIQNLFERGNAALVIIACNTASAEALRRLQDSFLFRKYPDRKILGVIVPTVEAVIEAQMRRMLLIGTKRTIESQKYQKEFNKQVIRSMRLSSVVTPELVPLIESDNILDALSVVQPIIDLHKKSGGDGVILGCTHYCILNDALRARYPDMRIFSQDEIIPKKLSAYLMMHLELEKRLARHAGTAVHETLFATA